jgi:hypothetical protein
LASSQATATAGASTKDLQADAPAEYTVQKGDTLWGISARFLKEPWKWPQIWQMNREQIKNPHLIYPGDVIRLDRVGDLATLSLLGGGSATAAAAVGNVVRLEPRTRATPLSTAVPSIPGSAIGPFLSQPLIINPGELDSHPQIVATEEERVIVGAGNLAYATGLRPGDPINWQVFRAGEILTDPVTGEVLGQEAIHVADARVKRFGTPSTLEVTRAKQEVNQYDRLMPAREASFPSYVPRAPDKPIDGIILSVGGGVSDFGQYAIVTINKGSRDGLEVGHVLASFRLGERAYNTRTGRAPLSEDLIGLSSWLGLSRVEFTPNPPVPDTKVAGADPGAVAPGPDEIARSYQLPSERSGLVFVFRTFEKISYGMVLKAVRPISVGDIVQTP